MLGAYGRLNHPSQLFSGISLKKVIDSKHGIDLGPLVPRVPEGMMTPDKKIHLSPAVFIERLQHVLEEQNFQTEQNNFSRRDSSDFKLIGRRHVSTNNSWMHQFRKLSLSKQVRCTAMINPEDASSLGVADGDELKVSSVNGEILIPAELTDAVMTGVVCIPHGFGHTRAGTQIPHAEAKPGVSVNDITDHNHIDELTGNAAFSGTSVTIERIGASNAAEITTGKPMLILYGSRTGNAEFTAREIATTAKEHQLLAQVVAMDAFDTEQLAEFERILIVCSTYGEGDMPDNAQGLWDKLDQPDAPQLTNSNYSVLAFGDSSYETFCEAGKQWDKKLEELGATRIATRVDCDVDYLDAASDWIEQVLPIITGVGDQTELKITTASLPTDVRVKYNRNNPLKSKVVAKRLLTASTSSKETWHIELLLGDEEISYVPGDTINIIPINRDDLVLELLALMGTDGLQPMPLSANTKTNAETVRECIANELELRIPSKALIERIATESPHEHVKQLFSSKNSQDIERYLWGKDIVDLLCDNKGVIDSIEVLLPYLQPITPRSYSIASSVSVHPSAVHLTVAVVRYDTDGRAHHGAGSSFLADITTQGDEVKVYFAPKSSFVLPEDESTSIIMIGPGTGIAPFMGFLQERNYRNSSGKNWLFFGDRNSATDFLYEEELSGYVQSGLLTHLDLAFSRDQDSKVYVQDRMLEKADELYRWLENGASVYVCGDATYMANDVDIALRSIIQTQGHMSVDEATDYIDELKRNKRYLRDVY